MRAYVSNLIYWTISGKDGPGLENYKERIELVSQNQEHH